MKIENERFSFACSSCRENLKIGNFTSSSRRVQQISVLKSVLHMQHDYLCCFNQIYHCFAPLLSPPQNLKVLHCASLLRTIFASLARAHEHVRIQNVRDFAQTKPNSEINAPFLSNEHGDPRFFFQVFAKNSLIKNIFEEEKKFDSRT